ncbi:hypothetical protein HD554DRAFT_2276785, partial [Boletus coccyginus]
QGSHLPLIRYTTVVPALALGQLTRPLICTSPLPKFGFPPAVRWREPGPSLTPRRTAVRLLPRGDPEPRNGLLAVTLVLPLPSEYTLHSFWVFVETRSLRRLARGAPGHVDAKTRTMATYSPFPRTSFIASIFLELSCDRVFRVWQTFPRPTDLSVVAQ